MSDIRHKITDITGGRANSQTGNSEIDFAAGADKVVLEMNGENLMKVLGVSIQLMRMPAPIQGQTAEFRAFQTEWWTVGHTTDNKDMTISFEIQGGGHIGFRVPADQAHRLYEAMGTTMKALPK
jgi:hypothetical protein